MLNFLLANTMEIEAEAVNISQKHLQQLNKMSEPERKAEKRVVRAKDKFVLNNVERGKAKVTQVKPVLLPAQSFSGKARDRARAPPHTPEHLQGVLKSELLRCSGMLHSPIHLLATPNIYGC